jgi:hypothetical protein
MPTRKPTDLPFIGLDEPQLLMTLLRYVAQDVHRFSTRGAQHIELAITMLAEDTEAAEIVDDGPPNFLS